MKHAWKHYARFDLGMQSVETSWAIKIYERLTFSFFVMKKIYKKNPLKKVKVNGCVLIFLTVYEDALELKFNVQRCVEVWSQAQEWKHHSRLVSRYGNSSNMYVGVILIQVTSFLFLSQMKHKYHKNSIEKIKLT